MVRLNGGRGTEPLNPWWQETRLRNCKPVYRNHTQACGGIAPQATERIEAPLSSFRQVARGRLH
jgi:hypothetical protein